MASRRDKDKAVNVQVLLRCRPSNEEEQTSNVPQVVTCNEHQSEVAIKHTIAGKQMDRVFTFDKVFGPSTKQKDLYEQAIVPIVNEVLEGFNCTIFAYGQTGTGKTYTMEGDCKGPKCGPKGPLPSDAGVIPRVVKQIFDTLESQNAEYSVRVTFLELYNEEITDLLAPEELSKFTSEDRLKKPLPLMEDGKGGVLVRGLEEEIVTNAQEIFTLLEKGSAKRRTAETLLNKQSSRSHSLFSITIHIKEATPEGEELIKCGKLNLVDLAGSENISRSGAREGRAREAGEINKSLLTLGRVINALVEHVGYIPYRDSKLTRLLRDSLGGKTKTCIIATVSPSIHCLEETLGTLDYAHRAKNIKNRPEVNQKMTKSTLIKELYGEIERLKAEIYATREKVGVYIPKERYYQEESERKAMADQIKQIGILLETNQKQVEDLQEKYDAELQHSADLSKILDATAKSLDHTSRLLAASKEELRKAQYTLKEKDFVISEQMKAENALAHQARVLQADLEKSVQVNASLFSKIEREDQLNAANKSIVNNCQADLTERISALCNTVAASMAQQKEHLQSIEEFCYSSLNFHDEVVSELKKKVSASRSLYISHIEAIQNIVRMHKACANASLEEMSSLTSSNCCSLDQLLGTGGREAEIIFGDLQGTLSNHQGEIADFTHELRKRFRVSLDCVKGMSNFIVGLLDKLQEESKKLQNHSDLVHKAQLKSIADFQIAYEEQSRSESDKLLTDIRSLLSSHMHRQKEMVDARLTGLRDAALGSKTFLDGHASLMECVTADAKRKWETLAMQAENDSKDGSEFSAAKHCRMEVLLQKCVSTVDAASQHWKKTHESFIEMSNKHVTVMEAFVRNAAENNDHYEAKVASARTSVEEYVAKSSEVILQQIERITEHNHESVSEVIAEVESHTGTLQQLQKDHNEQAGEMKQHTVNTFSHIDKEYEPTSETPVKSVPDVPSKGSIESLRALPMEALLEVFRGNHPYESFKEPRPSLITCSPLIHLN